MDACAVQGIHVSTSRARAAARLPSDGMPVLPAAGSDAALLQRVPTGPAALERAGTAATAASSVTCILPVKPATIYEHSIAARPNFDQKQKPASSKAFLLVNGIIITLVVVCSSLEILAKPA